MNLDDEVCWKVVFEDFKLFNELLLNLSLCECKVMLCLEDVCNRCGVKGYWVKDCLYFDNRFEELRLGLKLMDKCCRCGEFGYFVCDCLFDEDICKIC